MKVYDAGDYIIPTVKMENVEAFKYGHAKPRSRWQRSFGWLIPKWRHPKWTTTEWMPFDSVVPDDPRVTVRWTTDGLLTVRLEEPPSAETQGAPPPH